MFHEVTLKRVIVDQNGDDKLLNERYLTENKEVLSESEYATLQLFPECDVTCIKVSTLLEFINKRENEKQFIYLINLEQKFLDENGKEITTKYAVGLFCENLQKASSIALEYAKESIGGDMELVSVRKTKFIDIIK